MYYSWDEEWKKTVFFPSNFTLKKDCNLLICILILNFNLKETSVTRKKLLKNEFTFENKTEIKMPEEVFRIKSIVFCCINNA